MQRRGLREQSTIGLLLLCDLAWAIAAYVIAFFLRIYFPLPLTADFLPVARLFELRHMLPAILLAEIATLYVFGFYDLRALRAGFRPVANSVTALFVHLLATTALYFFSGDVNFPRSVLVVYWLVNAAGVAAIRVWIGRRLAASSPVRVLLVGTAEEVGQFLEGVGEPRLHHVDIVGAVSVAAEGSGNGRARSPFIGDLPWLGDAGDLPRLLVEHDVGEIVLLSPLSWRDRLVDRMLRQSRRPRVSVVPSVYDILVGRVSSGRIHDIPVVEVVKNPRDDLSYVLKRGSDFLIAGMLLVATLPLALLAAVAVKLGSPGPILYRQRRVGQAGAQFTIWKFRTMFEHAERGSGPVLASHEDRRVTPVGRILRASRVDEIPQLWNVLNGTMSLIGPRPERPEFVRRYAEEIPGYLERLQVKPGLTGLAQVNGEYHTSPAYKLKYDLAYIYNYSITLDLKIMAETVKVMVTRRGV
ncbi:MAG: sugar transferase [Deltaproteobacteria bacterium]|nr:sugar transferase [Deltaproteobacteria bacterium]